MPKTKCGGCSKDVAGKSVQCACCNLWYHTPCVDMKDELYNNIVATHEAIGVHVWACKACTSSIKALNARVVAMESKMRKLQEDVTSNTEKIDVVEGTVNTMQTSVQTLTDAVSLTEPAEATKDDIFKEMAERESRKTNIIIYGIQESTSTVAEARKEHDRVELDKVLHVLAPDNCREEDIKFLYRTGEREKDQNQESTDPRPLVVGFRSAEVQLSVLNSCRKLKNSTYEHISISPDLTKRQRKEDKDIRDECTRLNAQLTDEERLNWTWKVIGQKGQKKTIKVRVRFNNQRNNTTVNLDNTSRESQDEQGTQRTRSNSKRNRSKERISPGRARKR